MMWAKVAAVFNLIVIVFWLYQWGSFANILMSAQAAPADPVPACEIINTADAIVVYRCLPDEGLPYLLNSYGFMVVEE